MGAWSLSVPQFLIDELIGLAKKMQRTVESSLPLLLGSSKVSMLVSLSMDV